MQQVRYDLHYNKTLPEVGGNQLTRVRVRSCKEVVIVLRKCACINDECDFDVILAQLGFKARHDDVRKGFKICVPWEMSHTDAMPHLITQLDHPRS